MTCHPFGIYSMSKFKDSQAVGINIVRIRKEKDTIDLQVPINQTGPADSERIPRPLKTEISFAVSDVSRSWSAVHTQVP